MPFLTPVLSVAHDTEHGLCDKLAFGTTLIVFHPDFYSPTGVYRIRFFGPRRDALAVYMVLGLDDVRSVKHNQHRAVLFFSFVQNPFERLTETRPKFFYTLTTRNGPLRIIQRILQNVLVSFLRLTAKLAHMPRQEAMQ